MTITFQGDPMVKAALLDALPLAGDVEGLADRAGLPLPVAALLFALNERMPAPDGGPSYLATAVAAIPVGADMSGVATRAAVTLLDAPELAEATGPATTLLSQIRALHKRRATGDAPDRAEWKALREAALSLSLIGDRRERLASSMCEAACWPADRGQSTLPMIFRRWVDLAEIEAAPDWSLEDDSRSEALLSRLWDETSAAREAGEPVRYPALFRAADPDLFQRYEQHLAFTNRRVVERGREFGAQFLSMLADAPVR